MVILVSGVAEASIAAKVPGGPCVAPCITSTAAVATAFSAAIPIVGGWIVAVCAFLFGYTTLIGWAYYGEQFLEYLLGRSVTLPYRWIYCPLRSPPRIVWAWGDLMNALRCFEPHRSDRAQWHRRRVPADAPDLFGPIAAGQYVPAMALPAPAADKDRSLQVALRMLANARRASAERLHRCRMLRRPVGPARHRRSSSRAAGRSATGRIHPREQALRASDSISSTRTRPKPSSMCWQAVVADGFRKTLCYNAPILRSRQDPSTRALYLFPGSARQISSPSCISSPMWAAARQGFTYDGDTPQEPRAPRPRARVVLSNPTWCTGHPPAPSALDQA